MEGPAAGAVIVNSNEAHEARPLAASAAAPTVLYGGPRPEAARDPLLSAKDKNKCRVDNCKRHLSREKTYFRRYRCCMSHSKAPSVLVDGQVVRWCQQCCCFHELSAFDDDKRNCRERLVMHNERRNKRKVLSQAAAREERCKDRPQRLGPNGLVLSAGADDDDDDALAAGGAGDQARPKRTRVPVKRLGADGMDDDSGISDDDVDSGNSLSFSRRSATASRSPSGFHRSSLSRSANAFARDSGVSVGGGYSPFSRLSGGRTTHVLHGGASLDPLDDVLHAPTRPRSQTPARGPVAIAAGSGAAPAVGGLEALMAAAEQETAAAQQAGDESAVPRGGVAAALGARGGAFQAPPRSSGTFQPIVTPQQALSVQQLWDSAVAEQRDAVQAVAPHQPQPWKYARPLPAPMPVKQRSSAPDLLGSGSGAARLHTSSNMFQRDSGASDMSHFTLANALAVAFPAAAAAAQHQQGSGLQPPPGGFVTRSVPRMSLGSAGAVTAGGRGARDDSPPSDETVAAPLSARSSYNSAAGPTVMDLSPWGGLKTGSSMWGSAAASAATGQARLPAGGGEGAAAQQQSPRSAPAPLTVRAPPTNAFGGIARRGEPAAEAASVLAAAQRRAGKADASVPFSAPAEVAATFGIQSAGVAHAAMPQLGPLVQRPVALMPRQAAAAAASGSGYSNVAETTQQAQQAVTALINNALLEALLRSKAEHVVRAQHQQQQLSGALLAALGGHQGSGLSGALGLPQRLVDACAGDAAALKPAAAAPVPAAATAIGPSARPSRPSSAYMQWVGIMRASLIASPVRGELQAVQWTPTAPLGSCLWWQRRLGSLLLLLTITGQQVVPPGLWIGLQGLAEMSLRLSCGSIYDTGGLQHPGRGA